MKNAPKYLKTIYQVGPKDFADQATERIVTVMFIDIVGFSRMAEQQTPKQAFSRLKKLMKELRLDVIEHGGYVDRTLGDGMLCVFGYDQKEHPGGQNHANSAVLCAASIQRKNVRRILGAQKSGEAVFPLRIGINTAGSFVGNLGDRNDSDFTVIGNGVNFASRLESSCDRHMVMIGTSTRELVRGVGNADAALRKRYIRIKHHSDLQVAFEYDPFLGHEGLLVEGDEAYRLFIGAERGQVRHPCPAESSIRVHTNLGDGGLVNYSDHGFTIKLHSYYAVGVIINMTVDAPDGYLGEQ